MSQQRLGPVQQISIHALREEGDGLLYDYYTLADLFLSTPSARRATRGGSGAFTDVVVISIHALREEGDFRPGMPLETQRRFLSTPSARRATGLPRRHGRHPEISIHALREEGDAWYKGGYNMIDISIHALREEGDSKNRDKISIFKQIIQHSARI